MKKSSEIIYFNGHSCTDFGLINVRLETGMFEEEFIPNRTLNKERIKWKDDSYFGGIETKEKSFDITLAFMEGYRLTKEKIRNIAKWLNNSSGFKELWFSEDCELDEDGNYDINKPTRIYFATLIDTSGIKYFTDDGGYITLKFETNSPYCYSKLKTKSYTLKENDEFELDNNGDLMYRPEISLKNLVKDQKVKIVSENFKHDNVIDEYIQNDTKIDFELSEAKKSTGEFFLTDTVYDGETVKIGDNTYEFDLGDNRPKNKKDKKHILCSVDGGKRASNTLFIDEGTVTDGSTIMIGDQTFEFDGNNICSSTNVKVDISNYMGRASGKLHLNSNLMPNQIINVGDVNYTMVGGTNSCVIKMTDHKLTDGTEQNISIKTNKTNAKQDTINVSTEEYKDIKKCLVRNTTKNPSDLGIRKMKYLDKDFVMTLWDGESDEDVQDVIENVGIKDRIIVRFEKPLDINSINSDTIIIRNLEGNKIPVLFDVGVAGDMKKIVGIKPAQQYEHDEDYIINVTKGVKYFDGTSSDIKKIKFHTKKTGQGDTRYQFTDVSPVRVFTFSCPFIFDKSTVNENNLYIIDDADSSRVEVNYLYENGGKDLIVLPKTKYLLGHRYEMYFTNNIKDINGNKVVLQDKTIIFTISKRENSDVVDVDVEQIIRDFKIYDTISISFPKKVNLNFIHEHPTTIQLRRDDGELHEIFCEYDGSDQKSLKITPNVHLKKDRTYYLYISAIVMYEGGQSIERNRKIKIITESSKSNNSLNDKSDKIDNIDDTVFTNVNEDKVIEIDFGIPLNKSTIGDISVRKSNGQSVITMQKINSTGTGVKIYPIPAWERGEKYNVYAGKNLKVQNKPRFFAGDLPQSAIGKGDYENAIEIFKPLGFEIVRTNDFIIMNNEVLDIAFNKVPFFRNDVVIGGDGSVTASDHNPDGTIKDGTRIVSIPLAINTNNAYRLYGKDRLETRKKMLDFANKLKGKNFDSNSLYNSETIVATFTVRTTHGNSDIHVDNHVQLEDSSKMLFGEVPKCIKNMRPNDDIWLYEENEYDFIVDRNMIIPNSVPVDAKAYACNVGNVVNGIPDDYTNAQNILRQLGYTIIDTVNMSFSEKSKIKFKDGDLVIGGELAGATPSDFDAHGNLKSTAPQVDNPDDKRRERVAGIPRGIDITPARRLQGSGNETGRSGTKKAMEDWASLVKTSQSTSPTLPEGAESNIGLTGITVKYRVSNGAKCYGTGIDFYNGLRYLGDMGYEFVNVGFMSYEEKLALPFKKGDLILGGTGASDKIKDQGQEVTVTGIPDIPLYGALRLWGNDRYQTEIKIKQFAESLKVTSLDAGDIIRLEITTDSPDCYDIDKTNIAQGDDPALGNVKINSSNKVEFHRIKSIKELSRNRVYIEFEENIRTFFYIRNIDITNLYKNFKKRKAENFLFTAPYQIKIGFDMEETLTNIVKAINDTGTAGQEYSLRTYKHNIVLAHKINKNEDELVAIEMGTKGNIPVSLIDRMDYLNKFLTPTLEGGKDCSQSDALVALEETILKQNDLPERYSKDRYTTQRTTNSLTVTHILKGSKYNNIICLANVTKIEETPYLINEKDVVNLQEFLNREKQIARWSNPTFTGGEDVTIEDAVNALKHNIDRYQFTKVETEKVNKEYYGETIYGIRLTSKDYGEKGKLLLKTTCVYGLLSAKRLLGGIDGLEKNEELYMNCNRQEIVSNLEKDRYLNFNNGWLKVPMDGLKFKVVNGEIEIIFKYREKFLL